MPKMALVEALENRRIFAAGTNRNQLPVSNAYSADGDVQGELVFANYGLAEDYALLDSLKIDLRGKRKVGQSRYENRGAGRIREEEREEDNGNLR